MPVLDLLRAANRVVAMVYCPGVVDLDVHVGDLKPRPDIQELLVEVSSTRDLDVLYLITTPPGLVAYLRQED